MQDSGAPGEALGRVRRRLPSLCVSLLWLLSLPTVCGQSTTYARLVGTVKDQTEAVLPGVEVTATAQATNVPNLAPTNDRGNYLIDKLIPGFYEVKAELPGFKSTQATSIRLEVNQVGRVDFSMEPGEISEIVTVRGQTPSSTPTPSS